MDFVNMRVNSCSVRSCGRRQCINQSTGSMSLTYIVDVVCGSVGAG